MVNTSCSGIVSIGGNDAQPVLCGANQPLVVICGPCVIEGRNHLLAEAEKIVEICKRLELPLIFKSS